MISFIDMPSYIRIDMKSLMWVMKFVYHLYDWEDVKELYHKTKAAGLNLPLKPLNIVKKETLLPNPLAITDYLSLLDPKIPLDETKHKSWKNQYQYISSTEFRPALTDNGLCQVYNGYYERDIFTEDSVSQFHEVFYGNKIENQSVKLETFEVEEFTFILDLQTARRNHPFDTKDGTHFARCRQ